MAQLHVEAEGVAHAAPAVVWELVANADRYHQWGPWSASGYQSPDDHANGPGVIRWMRYGRTTTVEKVLDADKGRRLTYTVVKGIPVRNYRAEVTLSPEGEGTHIRWTASWDRTLPGRIVHLRLRAIYPRVVSMLIAAADQKVPAGSQRD
jgi:uncharacterized protein YndB with AHSA1/START domain